MGAKRVNIASLTQVSKESVFIAPEKYRRAVKSKEPEILTDIYKEDTNIVIWQRELSQTLKDSVKDLLNFNSKYQTAMTATPESVAMGLSESFGEVSRPELVENITELVDMFCCLFDLKRVGLRLVALDRAMCPKFHVDRVPCRLVCTYQGEATEWLPHNQVERAKLGRGAEGQPDHLSGLFEDKKQIQKLNSGDVGLLKGEIWQENENAGLVHRSPSLSEGERRLLLTLDFIN